MSKYNVESIDQALDKKALARLRADIDNWRQACLSSFPDALEYIEVPMGDGSTQKTKYFNTLLDRTAKAIEHTYYRKYRQQEVDMFLNELEEAKQHIAHLEERLEDGNS